MSGPQTPFRHAVIETDAFAPDPPHDAAAEIARLSQRILALASGAGLYVSIKIERARP